MYSDSRPDVEPRHVPTRVAFFALPGGRVRSAVGGHSSSAALTVDGRVFKWGLRRGDESAIGNKIYGQNEGSESHDRGDGGRDNGRDALKASLPRHDLDIGVKASQLSNGERHDCGECKYNGSIVLLSEVSKQLPLRFNKW